MATHPLAADASAAGTPGATTFAVEVCYASDAVQFRRVLQVAAGTTLEQAIVLSGVVQEVAEVAEVDLATMQVGVYGKKKPLDTPLRAHDRVEIYRALIADPKHARRRRKPAAAA
jgi:putative ubiquitin-RnfH superfamily antitoxin RatB of RatAB toxin-antitoxin module